MSCSCVVRTVTRLWAGWSGFWILVRTKYFLLLCNIQPGAGAHPALCLMGTGLLSGGVKCLGCDSDQALLSRTEVELYLCFSQWKCGSSSNSSSRSLLSFSFYCCTEEDSTEQPQFVLLTTDRSHFTKFLFVLFCFNTRITQLSNLRNYYQFNTIWPRHPVATLIFRRRLAESENTVMPSATCLHC